jgi:integrase/recombinase XerD
MKGCVFMSENIYENFRNTLTSNLLERYSPDQIAEILTAVDLSMSDYEIYKKQTDIIPASGIPEVVKLYLASRAIAHLSAGSLEQYRWKLEHFFRTVRKPFTDITANDIRIYLYHFKAERNASDNYMENIRGVLATFFAWLVNNEYLTRNPCAKVDKIRYNRHRRQALTPLQLEECRFSVEDLRDKAMIDFFYSTGCRVSECAAITKSDIDWPNRSVLIRHGKGDKERLVYFNAECEVSLQAYLSSRSDTNDALFVSKRAPHHAITKGGIEDVFRRLSKVVGLHLYPHKLRHTFATIGIRSGMPLEQLQALLGHASPNTTLVYAHQDQTAIQRQHQRIYA